MARSTTVCCRPLISWLIGMMAAFPSLANPPNPASDTLATLEQHWQASTRLSDRQQRLREVEAILQKLRALPAHTCISRWLEAEILMDRADIKHNLASLDDLYEARQLLETCLSDPTADIAGIAAAILGHLYIQLPPFPLSFGDRDKAEEYFTKALQLAPDNMAVNYYYGDYMLRQGDTVEATKFLRKGLTGHFHPEFPALAASYRQIITVQLNSHAEKPTP